MSGAVLRNARAGATGSALLVRRCILGLVLFAIAACESAPPASTAGTSATPSASDASASTANATSNTTANTAASGVVIFNSNRVDQQLGKPVTVKGVAFNAKLSAIVQAADLVVYCSNIQSWPSGAENKPIAVRGTFEKTDKFIAQIGPNGEQSQGTGGPIYRMRDCVVAP